MRTSFILLFASVSLVLATFGIQESFADQTYIDPKQDFTHKKTHIVIDTFPFGLELEMLKM